MRGLTLLTFAVIGLLCGGCTKASQGQPPPAAEPTSANARGLLDPTDAKEGTAERAVLDFLRFMQVDAVPVAVRSYHPRVLEAMTVDSVLTALDSQQAGLEQSRVENLSSAATPSGALVTLTLRFQDGGSKRHSFLLRRGGDSWRILYDSFLEAALAFQAQQRMMERTRASKPTPESMAVARRVSTRYQRLFLEGSPSGNPDSDRGGPSRRAAGTPSATITPTP